MHGVAHRDIKPGNILYAAAPTDVRIGDFGLALNVHAQTTQITGVGSPAYMSPEQIREELVDHRTDLYSLGVVMYQLLSGKLPFQATNKFSMIYQITQHEPPPPSAHRRAVPASLDRIVRRAMHKEADKRYHSGDEFAHHPHARRRSGAGDDELPRQVRPRLPRHPGRAPQPGEYAPHLGIVRARAAAPRALLPRLVRGHYAAGRGRERLSCGGRAARARPRDGPRFPGARVAAWRLAPLVAARHGVAVLLRGVRPPRHDGDLSRQ